MENHMRAHAPSTEFPTTATAERHKYSRDNFLHSQYVTLVGFFKSVSRADFCKVVIMICIDGLIKPDAPGSLRQAAKTTLLPDNWATVPLSLGLIMCKT